MANFKKITIPNAKIALTGPTGPGGSQGPQGPVGPTGPTGPIGSVTDITHNGSGDVVTEVSLDKKTKILTVTKGKKLAGVATSGSYNDLSNKPDLNAYLPKAGGSLSGVVQGGVIDVHPENGGTILSYYTNDLAFLTQRGGSYKVTNTTKNSVLASGTKSDAGSAANRFDGSPSYYEFSVGAVTDTVVIRVKAPETYSWSTNGGIGFGSSTWRAKNVKIEMGYSATNKGSAQSPDADIKWATRVNVTNNGRGIVYGNLNGPSKSEGGTSSQT